MISYRLNLELEILSSTVIRLIQMYANNIVFTLKNKALFI